MLITLLEVCQEYLWLMQRIKINLIRFMPLLFNIRRNYISKHKHISKNNFWVMNITIDESPVAVSKQLVLYGVIKPNLEHEADIGP